MRTAYLLVLVAPILSSCERPPQPPVPGDSGVASFPEDSPMQGFQQSANEADTVWPPGLFFVGEGEDREIVHVRIPVLRDRSDAIPVLVQLVEKSGDPGIRRSAVTWLEGIGPKARNSLPTLQKALRDPSPSVREAAARAIVAIESQSSIEGNNKGQTRPR